MHRGGIKERERKGRQGRGGKGFGVVDARKKEKA